MEFKPHHNIQDHVSKGTSQSTVVHPKKALFKFEPKKGL